MKVKKFFEFGCVYHLFWDHSEFSFPLYFQLHVLHRLKPIANFSLFQSLLLTCCLKYFCLCLNCRLLEGSEWTCLRFFFSLFMCSASLCISSCCTVNYLHLFLFFFFSVFSHLAYSILWLLKYFHICKAFASWIECFL